MDYPFWDVGIGYGLLMASIAVIHVFVSHFAIGGGLYLVIAEMSARKSGDSQRLDYLQRMSKFFVLVSVVFGALTGVGIWFIIGLLNPAATAMLIHNFVWFWATEWTFFAVEIMAALIYFYGWKTMSPRNHIIVGWIYFISAWLSLFAINGIITFMLTPGDWLVTNYIWDGFFNPTFWSSLWLRTGICIMLAGLYALLVSSRYQSDDFKTKLVRYNSIWGLCGVAIVVPTFYWYMASIPESLMETASEMMPYAQSFIDPTFILAGGIGLLLILFGLLIPRSYNLVVAIVMMALGLGWFGSYEFLRESIRKPYVITGYMYGNAVELAHEKEYQANGYLASMAYRTGNDGADLFRRACRSCHTLNNYKPLKPALDGTDAAFIAGLIRGAHVMKGNMPPFLGTEEEIETLATFIESQIDGRPFTEIYSEKGITLGQHVYEVRCGNCHQFGGYNDKSESLLGLEDEDYHDLLDMAEDFADEMPPFTGDSTEREALIAYLKSLGEGGN